MKYQYPRSKEAVSVAPPKELTPPPAAVPVDTVQDLINRKQEAEKNRFKYHLTEADCNLICTNATELHFSSGQVIADIGTHITSVYRIKCGRVALMKGNVKLFDLSQGYFIGEGLFIRGEAKDIYGAALVADGTVVLHEVNLPFVRQLLEVDKVLAFKIYRHMASKLSALLFNGISKISSEILFQAHGVLTRSDSSSSTSSSNSFDGIDTFSSGSDSSSTPSTPTSAHSAPSTPSSTSSSSISSGFTGSEKDFAYPPKAVIMSGDMVSERARKKKVKKCKVRGPKLVPFKTYTLDMQCGGQVALDTKKVIISGCGLRNRKKIKYTNIVDLSKTGKNTATIIFNFRARTLFFKTEDELNEFCGLVQSLINSNTNKEPPSPNPAYPLANLSDEQTVKDDKAALMKVAVKQELVKGDVIVAEGDLYQRLYIVASGQCIMRKGDRPLVSVQEGEVFGVLTLFHLRPSMLTIEVASDTCTLLIIPGYKFQELITTNFPLAVRLHKKAAQLVYDQIEKSLMSREGVVKGFGEPNVIL